VAGRDAPGLDEERELVEFITACTTMRYQKTRQDIINILRSTR